MPARKLTRLDTQRSVDNVSRHRVPELSRIPLRDSCPMTPAGEPRRLQRPTAKHHHVCEHNRAPAQRRALDDQPLLRYLRSLRIPGIHTQYDRREEVFMSVPHALLALLREVPKYGLQLQDEFEQRTGEVWPLNVGQVYTTLQRLERDVLVASEGEGEGPQKSYRITAEGRAELHTWLRTPPDLSSPPRDELVIKVLVAIGVPGVDVHEVIQAHGRHVVELMQQWTRIKRDAAADDLSLTLVVDAELFRLDSVIRWLDAAESRLRRSRPDEVTEQAISARSA